MFGVDSTHDRWLQLGLRMNHQQTLLKDPHWSTERFCRNGWLCIIYVLFGVNIMVCCRFSLKNQSSQNTHICRSGWWFGTWLDYCSIQLGIVAPTDELILFRGVGWNHQPAMFIFPSGHNSDITTMTSTWCPKILKENNSLSLIIVFPPMIIYRSHKKKNIEKPSKSHRNAIDP